jgi:hypothetical protein
MTGATPRAVSRWLICPWFDEGDDWPEQKGNDAIITAASKNTATTAYDRLWGPFNGLAWYEATTEPDWTGDHRRRAAAVADLYPWRIVPKGGDTTP